MTPTIPPSLLYANNTTDDDIRSCPTWMAIGWLIALIVAGWFSFKMMVDQYEWIGEPMALWLAVPAQPITNQSVNFNWNPPAAQSQIQSIGIEVFFEFAVAIFTCTLVAAAAAAALPHWPRPMLWLLMIFPLAAVTWYLIAPMPAEAVLELVVREARGRRFVPLTSSQKWSTVPPAFAVQTVGVAVGLLTGRMLAKLIATILLPRNMRAALLPYWTGRA